MKTEQQDSKPVPISSPLITIKAAPMRPAAAFAPSVRRSLPSSSRNDAPFLNASQLADHTRGIANGDDIRGQVFGHHRAGADDGVLASRKHILQQEEVWGALPAVIGSDGIIMGPVVHNIIGMMNKQQLLTVCGHIRALMA